MTAVPVFPHQVDTMAVFIPEGTFVGQGAVGHGDIIIIIVGGEGPALVVGHGVTWLEALNGESSYGSARSLMKI